MPTYIGFSSIHANQPKTTNSVTGIAGGVGGILKPVIVGKKYRLVDEALVIQDFVNALNIQQGQKVGQPQYGTSLWSYVFEPNTFDVQSQLEDEIKRVAGLDPRLVVNYVRSFPQENGILLEVQLAISPFNNPENLRIFFDKNSNSAALQS